MKDKMRVIIIDDEPYSRDELIFLLNSYDHIEVIAEAESAKEGMEKILSLQPDVIFVDIEMGEMSGLDMVEIVRNVKQPPRIVFATAYPDHAAKAFRLDAVDYLLKPFSNEELTDTVKRLDQYFSEQDHQKDEVTLSGKLAVELDGSIVYIPPETVLYCSRVDREIHIYTEQNMYQSKLSLKELEQKLLNFSFFRTHKSFVVNLNKVERLIPWFNGAYQLQVTGRKEEIPVSRNYVKQLRKKLEL